MIPAFRHLAWPDTQCIFSLYRNRINECLAKRPIRLAIGHDNLIEADIGGLVSRC